MPSKVGVYERSGMRECETHVDGDVRKHAYVRQLRTSNDPFGEAWSRFRSHFRFDSDDRQGRCRPTKRETGEKGRDASPFGTIYARLTMRKIMASLFGKVLVSREVGDLTDNEPPGISRLPKATNMVRLECRFVYVALKRIAVHGKHDFAKVSKNLATYR